MELSTRPDGGQRASHPAPPTLVLVAHGPTAATSAAAFPADEPLIRPDAAARAERADAALRGPELRCAQTAEAMGLAAQIDPALRECDHGRWRGRGAAEVGAEEPGALARWLADPTAAPPGGESVVELVARVGAWLDARPDAPRRVVAVTHPSVVRAALVHVLGAPPSAFRRLEVAPSARVALRGGARRWRMRIR